MAEGLYHPFTRALYEKDGDMVRVTTTDGASGLFHRDGRWVEGEVFEADPQLCGWIGGPRAVHHRIKQS